MDEVNLVLELLYDRGENYFLFGELADAAGIDSARLDRAIETLRQRGHHIEFSAALGLRLAGPAKLDAHLIERHLGTRRIGRSVICFEEVDSTNDVALDSVRQRDTDGLVICAEFQRCGRGRHGRRWVSPPHCNLLFSVLLIDSSGRGAHDALTIAAGLAVAEGIETACGVPCSLKWPNDVLADGAKTAGVLVELTGPPAGRAVVLGVGINVNAAPQRDQTDLPATCLADQVGHSLERTEVLRAVLRRLDERVEGVEQGRGDELHDAWLARCGMLNDRIVVMCAGRRYVGRVIDVSPLKGLVLCQDNGRSVHLPAANSTVLAEGSAQDR